MKAWIVYSGKPEWIRVGLLLENGWCPFQHICSDYGFAYGDLWGRRKERQEIFKKMGIDLEIEPGVFEEVQFLEKDHLEILEKNKDRSNWEPLQERYNALEKEAQKPADVSVHQCGDGSLESALENGGVDA